MTNSQSFRVIFGKGIIKFMEESMTSESIVTNRSEGKGQNRGTILGVGPFSKWPTARVFE